MNCETSNTEYLKLQHLYYNNLVGIDKNGAYCCGCFLDSFKTILLMDTLCQY